MQDRFKFRVWKGQENRMVYDVTYLNPLILDPAIKEENKHNILMQCTGLNDKNGKLIYESDIVRFKDNITINGSKTHIAVIEHNETFNTFMYHAECMGLYTVNKAQNEKFNVEVIGNIYENKELLNEI